MQQDRRIKRFTFEKFIFEVWTPDCSIWRKMKDWPPDMWTYINDQLVDMENNTKEQLRNMEKNTIHGAPEHTTHTKESVDTLSTEIQAIQEIKRRKKAIS